jgi:hypothetical protein
MANYHYYLKQVVLFEEEKGLVEARWDTENPMRLHVVCADNTYSAFGFVWDVIKSTSLDEENATSVAVIDGGIMVLYSLYAAFYSQANLPSHCSSNPVQVQECPTPYERIQNLTPCPSTVCCVFWNKARQ